MSTDSEILFSIKILKFLNVESQTVVFSPYTILNSLVTILYGSNNNNSAAEQICKVIGGSRDDIIKKYANLTKYLKSFKDENENLFKKNIFLSFEPFLSSFNETAEKFNIDYQNFGERSEINEIVFQHTKKQISNFMPIDIATTKDGNLLIFNTFYIHPEWDNEGFVIGPGLFDYNPENPKYPARSAQYLFKKIENEDWNLTENLSWKCLGIPFKSRKFWLHILMPKKCDGLNELMDKMDVNLLKECVSKKGHGRLQVGIPIFEIESSHSLNQILKNIGISNIFNSDNIQGIFNHPCRVNNIIHATKITVDEFKPPTPLTEQQKRMEEKEEEKIERFDAKFPFVYFITAVDKSVEDVKTIILMGKYC